MAASNTRITRTFIEPAVGDAASSTRVTRTFIEPAVGDGASNTRVTRTFIEVVVANEQKPGWYWGANGPAWGG